MFTWIPIERKKKHINWPYAMYHKQSIYMYIYMLCVHVHVAPAQHARAHIIYMYIYMICVHVQHARAHISYKCTCILTVYGILVYSELTTYLLFNPVIYS